MEKGAALECQEFGRSSIIHTLLVVDEDGDDDDGCGDGGGGGKVELLIKML